MLLFFKDMASINPDYSFDSEQYDNLFNHTRKWLHSSVVLLILVPSQPWGTSLANGPQLDDPILSFTRLP